MLVGRNHGVVNIRLKRVIIACTGYKKNGMKVFCGTDCPILKVFVII